MEENTKSGSFLTESCGRKPTAPTTQNYHFFDAAPKWKADTDSGLSLMVRLVNLSARKNLSSQLNSWRHTSGIFL